MQDEFKMSLVNTVEHGIAGKFGDRNTPKKICIPLMKIYEGEFLCAVDPLFYSPIQARPSVVLLNPFSHLATHL